MTYSLNEVEAMCRRAARGSGLSWGLAAEAGKAARWLAAHSLPGPAILQRLLERNDGTAYEELAPVDAGGEWRAPSGRLCPLIAGAALCDRSQSLAENHVWFGPTSHPVLLAPYVAAAARKSGRPFRVSWEGADLYFDDVSCTVRAVGDALLAAETGALECASCDRGEGRKLDASSRADVEPRVWAALAVFAHRTYAPATEQSRISGAGAGLSDNE